jgi:predicted DNA-binding transcriptional regulator AlpA
MKFEYQIERLLTDKEVAPILGVSVALLKRWRWCGGGPRYIKVGGPAGRAVRYRKSDIEAWLASNIVSDREGQR